MKTNGRKLRKPQGVGIAIITLMLGLVFLASLGLFSFEMMRHNTCFDELRSACEAAALAGAAAMASSDNTSTAQTRSDARGAAEQAFRNNSVVGNSLGTVDTGSMNAANYNSFAPPANKSAMFVEFVDPVTQAVVTDDNNPNGRVVRVSAAFTNEPPFGRFLGIPAVPMRTRANSSVPQLDIVMCFDTSGSIDDQTKVTLVARVKTGGTNDYQIRANDTIYTLMSPPATGSSFQAAAPQALNLASGGWTFNKDARGPNNDHQPAAYGSIGGNEFTDEVVNIDGKKVFGGITVSSGGQSYAFPDVKTLVEASRGNLEDVPTFTSSGAQAGLAGNGVSAKAGYQAAYDAYALANTQPIGAARDAAIQFFQIMNNNTDAHFGFVSFSTAEHHQLTDQDSDWRVSSSYTGPAKTTVKQPGIQLDLAADNLTSILGLIPDTRSYGSTNFRDSLQEAVDELKKTSGKSRSLSKKAVLFFTDGQPTYPSNGDRSWETAASTAKTEGIQIYTVGLAQNKAIADGEIDQLNAGAGIPVTYTDPNTGTQYTRNPTVDGMAALGAPNGRFFLVTNTANLRYVFENIARNLVQLVKTQ